MPTRARRFALCAALAIASACLLVACKDLGDRTIINEADDPLCMGAGCDGMPVDNSCQTDEDCDMEGNVCLEGQCRPCDFDDPICERVMCTRGSGCGPDEVCDDGVCVEIPPDCADADVECPQGMMCLVDPTMSEPNICTWMCSDDSQCINGRFCRDGVCARTTCIGDSSCGNQEICARGLCVRSCSDDDGCSDSQVCSHGGCFHPDDLSP